MGETSSTVNKKRIKKKGMRQLSTYHSGMAGYLMDFGFGGFIGYGKGVPVGLVMEELNRCDR